MNANQRDHNNQPAAIDLTVIVVSYNVRDLLRRCLRSIAASGLRVHTIVVDNASHDGSAEMIRAEFPDATLIASDRNLGFAGGNNLGLRRVLGEPGSRGAGEHRDEPETGNQEPETGNPPSIQHPILLLNPDTEIVGDALGVLVEYLAAHPEVAVVGPQLRYGDGTLQSSRRRWPTIGALFWESTLLEQWWPHNPWARRLRFEDQSPATIQQVDWLVGAALLVRRAAIEQAGLLDEGFFMYSEELEWQARLSRSGTVVYLPQAVVIHHEGKSSEQNLARRHINFNRSRLRYVQQRWGWPLAIALRVFLLATYVIQLGIEAAKWALGHKRALRRQRIAQYGAILRSGL
jgi:N-acetylglucosaminyl-diphospho-decaprenol L-rhamnosyltransferase